MGARTLPQQEVWSRRRAVLACALELGEELGEDGVSMRLIAKRLGWNPAVLYVYFADKRELVRELERAAIERLDRWLADSVVRHLDPAARLVHLCIGYADFARYHPWLYGLAFEHARAAVDLHEHWQAHPFVLRATVLIDDIAGRSNPVLIARQLCVAMHGLATAVVRREFEPMFVERYVESIVEGLCTPPCEPNPRRPLR